MLPDHVLALLSELLLMNAACKCDESGSGWLVVAFQRGGDALGVLRATTRKSGVLTHHIQGKKFSIEVIFSNILAQLSM